MKMSHLNKCYPNGRTPTTIIIFRGIIKKKKTIGSGSNLCHYQ